MSTPAPTRPRTAPEIDESHKWNLDDIYSDWSSWDAARAELERRIGDYAALKGTLAQGPDRLLAAYRLNDELGQLAYKVYFYPVAQVRRGPARQPGERAAPAGAGAHGALAAGHVLVQSRAADDSARRRCATGWRRSPELAMYRFAIEEVYRQQEHVLDEQGERLMSLVGAALRRPERGVSGALHRRREVSGDHAQHRREGDDVVRPVPRGARDEPSAGGSPRGVPRALRDVRRRASTRTRRSITASASATGFTRGRAATRRRSTPRCTATTSRDRSSTT